jgi:hypothetical protein
MRRLRRGSATGPCSSSRVATPACKSLTARPDLGGPPRNRLTADTAPPAAPRMRPLHDRDRADGQDRRLQARPSAQWPRRAHRLQPPRDPSTRGPRATAGDQRGRIDDHVHRRSTPGRSSGRRASTSTIPTSTRPSSATTELSSTRARRDGRPPSLLPRHALAAQPEAPRSSAGSNTTPNTSPTRSRSSHPSTSTPRTDYR